MKEEITTQSLKNEEGENKKTHTFLKRKIRTEIQRHKEICVRFVKVSGEEAMGVDIPSVRRCATSPQHSKVPRANRPGCSVFHVDRSLSVMQGEHVVLCCAFSATVTKFVPLFRQNSC